VRTPATSKEAFHGFTLRAILPQDPSRVHERGGDGQTPLHFARSRAVIDLLLDAGADLDARDLDHRATPAQWMLARRRDAERYALAA
jgi:ankyrin repeat protein